jgi:RNA polymerase sigma-70 factor (ECF subfamily)
VVDEPDEILLQRYRDGDAGAFRTLVLRYQRPVYNAAFWVLRRPEDAQDVAQTVFLRVAERSDEFDPQYKFFSWIYRIAVNEALNVQRRGEREAPLADDFDAPADALDEPHTRFADGDRARRLHRAMMELSMMDRTVITLRHFAELSYAEIGEALDIDEKTVKSRLFEARQRLRALLPELAA